MVARAKPEMRELLYNDCMDLTSFFNPASIAIIGVSDNPKKVGYLTAKNCIEQGYKGQLYFINPKHDSLLGKKVYKSVSDIGKPVDLAVLALPADVSLRMIDEMGALGIKNVLLYAAGFKETSAQGQQKELLLIEKAKKYGMAILGPNCLGFVNTQNGANLTFLKYPAPPGNIGFISQSGALGSLMVDYLVGHKNFGFSYFISMGNKTIIDECDALEFLAQDPHTNVIAMYLEDVKDGVRFKRVLTETVRKKPVVILKSGATKEGSKAAVSHTGSMMGDDAVYSAVFSQCGAIRANEFYEFMALLKLFSYGRLPSSKDILILSNAGGIGVLLTDELMKRGMSLVTISEETKAEIIQSMGGDKISIHNPIDLLGDASAFDYETAITSTLKERRIGAVIILLTPQANTEIEETTQVIARAQEHFDKPIYPIFMGEKSVGNPHTVFEEHRMASFSSYDFLPKALAKIMEYRVWQNEKNTDIGETAGIGSILSRLQSAGRSELLLKKERVESFLNVGESMEVLKEAGVTVEPLHLIDNATQLEEKARELGFPLVMKISSDTITHKTEVKGIITGINNTQGLQQAWNYLSRAGDGRAYMQKMHVGYELIAGAKRDGNFGTVLMVGLGGIVAELLKETASFIHPVGYAEFETAIAKTKMSSYVKGFRGMPLLNLKKLHASLSAVGFLMDHHEEIGEIDINPLMVTEGGIIAVDSRIVLIKSK